IPTIPSARKIPTATRSCTSAARELAHPMRLIQVLSIVLTQLSVGSLLMTSLLPTREIRLSFFTFNSLLCAVAAAVGLLLARFGQGSGWWEVRFLGLTVIGATGAVGMFR